MTIAVRQVGQRHECVIVEANAAIFAILSADEDDASSLEIDRGPFQPQRLAVSCARIQQENDKRSQMRCAGFD